MLILLHITTVQILLVGVKNILALGAGHSNCYAALPTHDVAGFSAQVMYTPCLRIGTLHGVWKFDRFSYLSKCTCNRKLQLSRIILFRFYE